MKRAEAKKEFEETVEAVELAEVEVNEEEVEWRQFEEEGGLDREQVRQAREEEMNYMVKTLGMFEFGSWQEGTSKAGKAPTTTELIDRVKLDDDGREFVRCRLVARDFKPGREGPRDDLFAAMPPWKTNKALSACVAGGREKRREQGQDEVKLVVIDVKKAHFNAKCDGEEWVELSDEFQKCGKYAKLKRWLYGARKSASGWRTTTQDW